LRNHFTPQIHFHSYQFSLHRPVEVCLSLSFSAPDKADDLTGLASLESETPEEIPAKATDL